MQRCHAYVRARFERTWPWEEMCKRRLLRFKRIQQRHSGMQLITYTLTHLQEVLRYLKLARRIVNRDHVLSQVATLRRFFSGRRPVGLLVGYGTSLGAAWRPPHDSGPMWFARPALEKTFTAWSLLVAESIWSTCIGGV